MNQRNILLILAVVFLALTLTVGIYLFLSQGKALGFETLKDSVLPEKTTAGNFQLDNEEDWKKMWQQQTAKEPKEGSGIDFSKDTVLAVLDGSKDSSGYEILIKQVVETKEKIKVFVEKAVPGDSCRFAKALSNPYHLVKLPKLHKEVVFVIKNKTVNCPQ